MKSDFWWEPEYFYFIFWDSGPFVNLLSQLTSPGPILGGGVEGGDTTSLPSGGVDVQIFHLASVDTQGGSLLLLSVLTLIRPFPTAVQWGGEGVPYYRQVEVGVPAGRWGVWWELVRVWLGWKSWLPPWPSPYHPKVRVLGCLMRVEVYVPQSTFAGMGVATVFLWPLDGEESSYCLKAICFAKLLPWAWPERMGFL